MARGSFNGLYTFQDVAKIYNIDASTIRKRVQNHKFYDNEIRKFGKTWLITEQAMLEHFGSELFIAYQNKLIQEAKLEKEKARLEKEAKRLEKEAKKEAKKVISMSDEEDDLPSDTWEYTEVDEKSVIKSFTF